MKMKSSEFAQERGGGDRRISDVLIEQLTWFGYQIYNLGFTGFIFTNPD